MRYCGSCGVEAKQQAKGVYKFFMNALVFLLVVFFCNIFLYFRKKKKIKYKHIVYIAYSHSITCMTGMKRKLFNLKLYCLWKRLLPAWTHINI